MSTLIGFKAENIAKNFLSEKGLVPIASNYRAKCGEIDLIMLDKEILVFVEVKYRKDNNFMEAYESINYSKQKKIKKTALLFVQSNNRYSNHQCRFDVVALCGNIETLEYHWLENAFY